MSHESAAICVQSNLTFPLPILNLLLTLTRGHGIILYRRSHGLFSLARTPGPWVRITLRTWMFSVCVQVEALRRADHPSKETYWLS
jgi:hypothetical protein